MPSRMNSSPTRIVIDGGHEGNTWGGRPRRGADGALARFFMMRGSLSAEGEWRHRPARTSAAALSERARTFSTALRQQHIALPADRLVPAGRRGSIRRRFSGSRKPGRTKRGFQINADAKGSENDLPISQPQGLELRVNPARRENHPVESVEDRDAGVHRPNVFRAGGVEGNSPDPGPARCC